VLYVASPALEISGRLSAVAATPLRDAGAGGLGRIRLSTLPARCSLLGNYAPPLADSCNATPMPTDGKVYIGVWPD